LVASTHVPILRTVGVCYKADSIDLSL